MACAVPCVVTEVGDSPLIVGETGLSVRPGDPEALAGAWQELLSKDRNERTRLGAAARRRIEEHFSLQDTVSSYKRLYEKVAARSGAP